MMLQDLIAMLATLLCLWAIVSPRVPTGIVGTLSLCGIAVGCLWSIDNTHDPRDALNLVLVGGSVLALFIARKGLRTRAVWMRRRDDWNDGWVAKSVIHHSAAAQASENKEAAV